MERVTDTRTGAITLATVAVALVVVFGVSGRHARPGRRIAVEIGRIGALEVGAPVRVGSLRLGSVDEITLVPRPEGPVARLDLWLDARTAGLVRPTSEVFLAQEGLLGKTFLEVAPGVPGPAVAEGAVMHAVDPPPIDALLAKSYENLEAAARLLRDGFPEAGRLGRALDGLGATLAGFETMPGFGALVREARGLELGSLGPVRHELAALSVAGLAPRIERFAAALGPLARRAGDGRLARLAAAMDRVEPIVAGLDRVRRDAGALAAWVASGRGTLGALLQDVELADEIKEMTKTMKREPWRALGRPQR